MAQNTWKQSQKTYRKDQVNKKSTNSNSSCAVLGGCLIFVLPILAIIAISIIIFLRNITTLIYSKIISAEDYTNQSDMETFAMIKDYFPYVLPIIAILAAFAFCIPLIKTNRQYSKEISMLNSNSAHEQNYIKPKKRRISANRQIIFFAVFVTLFPVWITPFAKFLPDSLIKSTGFSVIEIISMAAVVVGPIGLLISLIQSSMAMKFIRSPDYKNYYVRNFLNRVFSNVIFDPTSGLNPTEIANTAMLNPGNFYRSNDFLSATYRGISFRQADIVYAFFKDSREQIGLQGTNNFEKFVENMVSRRANPTTYTEFKNNISAARFENADTKCFKGRWLIATLPKIIESRFYIVSKNFPYLSPKIAKGNGLESVMLEDSTFQDIFNIYASNPHDVFYVVTPILLEKIRELSTLESGEQVAHGIAVFCQGNQIHFAIADLDDAFESFMQDGMPEAEIEKRLTIDTSVITSIIDTLQ